MAARAYHHGDLPSALLAEATKLLEERGVDGVTLREVARRAGVSSGAPYRHFADKNALLAAIAADGFDAFDRALTEKSEEEAPALERLHALGVVYIEFARASPARFNLMFGVAPTLRGGHPALRDAEKRAGAHLPRVIARALREGALRDGDPAELVLMAWSLVHGLARLAIDGQAEVDSDRIDRLVRLLVDAVTARS